jgi:nucleotide-binding universal stress UspA family protein
MKKALISVDIDLGSSIALRYADNISSRIQPALYDVHVVDPKQIGSQPGSGWVEKTWENALIESSREEIRQFLEMERVKLPLLTKPKILFGNRTETLLDELRNEQYDLFMEGIPPTFNPSGFHSLLNSRLYRQMPCPVLVVKNIVSSDRIALVAERGPDPHKFISCFLDIFNAEGLKVDLIDMDMLKSEDVAAAKAGGTDNRLEELKSILADKGVVAKTLTFDGAPNENVADIFRDYGVVVSSMMRSPRKNNPLLGLLGRIASPVLICWR